MPERESSASKEAPETAAQADDLDALFDAAETNGDTEAPDLEALRRALSARKKDEGADAASDASEASEASDREKTAMPEASAASRADAPSKMNAADASKNGKAFSLDERPQNGQSSAQHTERLRWLVDFVGTEGSPADRAAEDAPTEPAREEHAAPDRETTPPATEETEVKDAEEQLSAKAPEVDPELTGEAPSATEPNGEEVDLEAFQRAIQAQQEEAFEAEPEDDVVTEDELKALFGTKSEGREAEAATTDHEAEGTPEEAPAGWKTESAYASETPRTDEKTPPASSTSDEEDAAEEFSETASAEHAIGALYGERKASEGDAPEAAGTSEDGSSEADSSALKEVHSGEAEAAVPEIDEPGFENSEIDSTEAGSASDDVAQPSVHETPEEERTAPRVRLELGEKQPEDESGASGNTRPDEESFTASEEASPAEAEFSFNDRSGGRPTTAEGVPSEDPSVDATPGADKETRGGAGSRRLSPEKEHDSSESGAWRPAARHEEHAAAEDTPLSSSDSPASASVPGSEPDVETLPGPADAAAEEEGGADALGQLDPDVLAGSLHTDVLPEEEATFKDRIASVQEEVLHGDGHLEKPNEPSADGHTLDLGGNTPVANISNWMQGAQYASHSQKEAAGDGKELDADLDTSDRVVAFLLRSGAVTPEQVQEAQSLRDKEELAPALWRVLAEIEGVDREAVFAGAARVYAFPMADLEKYSPNPDFTKSVLNGFSEEKREDLLALGVVPYRAVRERRREALKLLFITHDPARPEVNRLLERVSVEFFEVLYAPESAVDDIIAKAFPKKNEYLERVEKEGGMAVDLGANYQEDDDLIDEDQLEAEISRSKLINLFEATLVEAVRQGASDIHIYPNAQKKVEIHFRIDGRLKHWHTEDKVHPEALLAVIKDNSMNVDRFERDAAQDGFIQRRVDEALIRFRVSVMPIANASQEVRSESIVIRVLDDRKVIKDLSKLGLLEGALEKFEHAISQPHGMVIMTGPTGSGKSTTLVAALHRVVSPEVNVLTIEDPVEYIIEDVRQIKLSHKLQLQDALRSLLRHDPDVVMVGEMRDRSTAELAIKLANTGHLTFSTLHTNDAPSAVARLYKMGIEPFLIAYAINLVVAQRLIRKLCPECKRLDGDPDPVMLQKLGFSEEEIASTDFYLPGEDENCPVCNGFGFKGRRAISEAMYFSREIRHMIVEADRMIDEDAIREQAQKEGMLTLRDSAREVVKMGETSVREMIRVVTSEAY